MNARLISLLLSLALALTFGCTSEASEPGTPTATSALPSPAAAIFATPTVGAGTAAPDVSPAHALGTRTGLPKVDAIIGAAEARDANALLALIHYYLLPCTRQPGIGAVPCTPGALEGTPTEVFGWGSCEGSFSLRGDPQIVISLGEMIAKTEYPYSFDPRVYAVVRGKLFPRENIPGDALIVFASGRIFSVDAEGLTYVSQMCIGDGEEWVEHRRQFEAVDFILAPPR